MDGAARAFDRGRAVMCRPSAFLRLESTKGKAREEIFQLENWHRTTAMKGITWQRKERARARARKTSIMTKRIFAHTTEMTSLLTRATRSTTIEASAGLAGFYSTVSEDRPEISSHLSCEPPSKWDSRATEVFVNCFLIRRVIILLLCLLVLFL
jgi:hypothetical protein